MILGKVSKSKASSLGLLLSEQIRSLPRRSSSTLSPTIYRRYQSQNNFSSSAAPETRDDLPPPQSVRGKMRSWQIHSYGDELQLSGPSPLPSITSPNDVLVKVKAASVNPIDSAMSKGYGAETLNVLRNLCNSAVEGPFGICARSSIIEFPLTLGRDFSGTIVEMGHGARGKHDGLKEGDDVFGVVGVQRQGSHAKYVLSSVDTLRRKPKNLDFVEAAAIPYVGLTSWAAIRVTGAFSNLAGKRFLVLGGSGGVGTFTIQYLKSQGANVVATCSSDAEPLLISLGADFVIDYKLQEYDTMIKLNAPYDCILDLSGPSKSQAVEKTTPYLKPVVGQFITLSPPFLRNMDKYGFIGGAMKNVGDLLANNYQTWSKGSAVTKWAFFLPKGEPLDDFVGLIESQKIRPVIHQIFKFDQMPTAYKAVEQGHLRGKIVIDMQ